MLNPYRYSYCMTLILSAVIYCSINNHWGFMRFRLIHVVFFLSSWIVGVAEPPSLAHPEQIAEEHLINGDFKLENTRDEVVKEPLREEGQPDSP